MGTAVWERRPFLKFRGGEADGRLETGVDRGDFHLGNGLGLMLLKDLVFCEHS